MINLTWMIYFIIAPTLAGLAVILALTGGQIAAVALTLAGLGGLLLAYPASRLVKRALLG